MLVKRSPRLFAIIALVTLLAWAVVRVEYALHPPVHTIASDKY